jgi:hypothetical protein
LRKDFTIVVALSSRLAARSNSSPHLDYWILAEPLLPGQDGHCHVQLDLPPRRFFLKWAWAIADSRD